MSPEFESRLVTVLEDLAKAVALLGKREAECRSVATKSRLLPAREVAALLSCHPRTLRRLVLADEIPKPIHIGGAPRWRLADIEKWLEQQR